MAPLLQFPGNFNDQTSKPHLAVQANPATPAGYAFAIWGVIYLGALGYAIYHALSSNAHDTLLQEIGWLTAAVYLLCIAWLLAARCGPAWMTVRIILGMLGCLGAADARLTQQASGISVRTLAPHGGQQRQAIPGTVGHKRIGANT